MAVRRKRFHGLLIKGWADIGGCLSYGVPWFVDKGMGQILMAVCRRAFHDLFIKGPGANIGGCLSYGVPWFVHKGVWVRYWWLFIVWRSMVC